MGKVDVISKLIRRLAIGRDPTDVLQFGKVRDAIAKHGKVVGIRQQTGGGIAAVLKDGAEVPLSGVSGVGRFVAREETGRIRSLPGIRTGRKRAGIGATALSRVRGDVATFPLSSVAVAGGTAAFFGTEAQGSFLRGEAGGNFDEAFDAELKVRRSVDELNATVQRTLEGRRSNLVRLAQESPDLFNELLFSRRFPRGAVPIGGNPDMALLEELADLMASGQLNSELTGFKVSRGPGGELRTVGNVAFSGSGPLDR